VTPPVIPPKPATRPDGVSLVKRLRLARHDLFATQPARLYRAWMAELKTPRFNSYFINQPELVREVLVTRPDDFPKSGFIRAALKSLLGKSVFVTNGAEWKRQRRIIDPAFEGGRLKDTFPAMVAAAEAAIARLGEGGDEIEVEARTAHLAADVIFRTLFSVPITDADAAAVHRAFQRYQRAQPLINFADLLRLPGWVPRLRPRRASQAAEEIRTLLAKLVARRQSEIEAGRAPDDLATKIMTMRDPETGEEFSAEEMVDQVAIFFLAGHETSASALAWGLYLLALAPQVQARIAEEADAVLGDRAPQWGDVAKLKFTRNVFREALRLYPPVPMLVREAAGAETFRGRKIAPGSPVILSPWHLHRHERIWDRPDEFDPDRWQKTCPEGAYMPFSQGPRICTGAGFAMVEGVLFLAMLARAFRFEWIEGRDPVPVAHLTVRSKDGIWLRVERR